jgi:hypothetical protein
MAYLAATNVTVTLNPEDIDRSPDGRIGIRTFPTVVYGNGALQYPALGIPMPAIAKFGFHFAIKRVYIEQPANGFIYHFDRTNHKLRIFLGAATAVAVSVANHANISLPTPTGNVAAPANHANITVAAPANHTHNFKIMGNGTVGAEDVSVGINATNSALVGNIANATDILGANSSANGGVMEAAVAAPANIANLTHNAPAFTGDAPANLANLTHTVTVSGNSAEAALAEMDDGVAPASTTLYMEMVGR